MARACFPAIHDLRMHRITLQLPSSEHQVGCEQSQESQLKALALFMLVALPLTLQSGACGGSRQWYGRSGAL
eukprot:4162023-Amphidinium_carterae.1